MKSLINLMHEVGMLDRTPRSGFAFLGSGQQSVAEHSHRMTFIAFVLSRLHHEPIDLSKLLMMCLLHDLPEARTGDLNYVNKRYVEANEDKVIEEMTAQGGIPAEIGTFLNEYRENQTTEAHIAHDADQIELLLVLKELHDLGNPRAMEWFERVVERVQTPTGKSLVETIRTTRSDTWWFAS
jgi:putative hydrolase of HD superfamily